MKIFDTHTHVFPDKIAHAVLEHLQEKSHGIPVYTDGTFADHQAKALAAGYTGWMNCPVVTHPGQHASLNRWVAGHNHWPALSLGGIHPDDEDLPGVLHSIQDLGLYGLKLHAEYQECGVLEDRMERVWNLCEEMGMRVLIHGGSDIGFRPPFHSRPADFVEVKRRHPALKLVVAHLGGWTNWDEVEEVLAGTDVLLDTSFSIPFMKEPAQFLRIVRKHGAHRVLFGTDSPWDELAKAVEQVRSSGLTEAELAAVFWDNAAQFWGFHDE